MTVWTRLSSVLLYDLFWLLVVYPAVLAASGSTTADGIVLTARQAVQTKLNQDNFLLVSAAAGAGPYCIFTDNPSTLSTTCCLFWHSDASIVSYICFNVIYRT